MIPYTRWTGIPLSTRIKIAEQFNIPKVRSTHVSNDYVQDDGYNVKDMETALSVPNMQAYLNSTETDLMILFQQMVDKVEGKVVEGYAPTALIEETPPLKVGKKIKKETKKVVKKKSK